MSGAAKSRSKSLIQTSQSLTEQAAEHQEGRKDEDMQKSAISIEASPPIIRRYKMPYRNFLRDVKIQMQNENLSNKEVAKIASQRWKSMTFSEKEPYIQEAAYARELELQSQKRSNHQTAKKQAPKRKRKCPKCGGYPASTSPSEQSGTEGGTGEESGEAEENNDYSSDSTCYSYSPQPGAAALSGVPENDAPKSRYKSSANKKEAYNARAQKRKTKEARDSLKRKC